MARGLDLVGERWTLLIVRDLLSGPKRYTDLLAGLPGIGTNLLAGRLRELEEQGIVVRRVLPPPAASAVYELSDVGQGLEPVIMALGRWGSRFLGPRSEGAFLSAYAYLVAMRASFQPEAAAGLSTTYELRIGHQVFEVRVEHGQCTATERTPSHPDVVLTMDVSTLSALLHRELSPEQARSTGRLTIDGDPRTLDRFVAMFALPTASQQP